MRREYPEGPVPAVGVIVRSGERVLLVLRGREPFLGYWTFPGGAIELGESAREAARREAREETGLEVLIGDVAAVVDNIVRDSEGRVAYHYVIIDYLAQRAGGALRPGSDVDDARWVGCEDLAGLPITQQASELLRDLLPPTP